MSIIIGLGVLIIITLIFENWLKNKDNKNIDVLEVKKSSDQTTLDALQKEQTTLKDTVTTSQANATEEQKKETWNEILNPKPNSNK